jgi:hypothetical protein
MRRLLALPLLVLTTTGCGADGELDAAKQAVSDTATVPKSDITCTRRSDHNYDCATQDGAYTVKVKYNDLAEGITTYRVTGSDFPTESAAPRMIVEAIISPPPARAGGPDGLR